METNTERVDQVNLATDKELEFLEQMVKNTADQRKYAKRQCIFSMAGTLFTVLVLVALSMTLLSIVPRVNGALDQLNSMADNINTVVVDLQQVDFTEITTNVNNVAVAGADGIAEALEQVGGALQVVESIDIEKLNTSIDNLNAVVEPMAKLFKR